MENYNHTMSKKGVKNMFIRLSKIKIPKEFQEHKPKSKKMNDKNIYFILNNTFKEKNILDKNNVLVDGYTNYLLSQEYEKKFIRSYRRK